MCASTAISRQVHFVYHVLFYWSFFGVFINESLLVPCRIELMFCIARSMRACASVTVCAQSMLIGTQIE